VQKSHKFQIYQFILFLDIFSFRFSPSPSAISNDTSKGVLAMPHHTKPIATVLLTSLALSLIACNTNTTSQPTPVPPATFSYQNTQNVQLEISALVQGSVVANAPVSVFQGFNPDGTIQENTLVQKGITDKNGVYRASLVLPADLSSIVVKVNYIGIISEPIKVEIKNGSAKARFDDQSAQALNVVTPHTATPLRASTRTINYTYQYLNGFGNWTSLGKPNTLLSNSSKVTTSILSTINATLPEGQPVPTHPIHQHYITPDSSANLVLNQAGEIFLTFVHEGAGYLNSVGYYLYDAANPPSSVSDISGRMIMAYPNFSFQNSGGAMQSGNRVQLKYYNSTNNTWSNTFPAGTGSDPVLNYQTYKSQGMTLAKSAQTVLLIDPVNQTLVLGMEDILRHHGGDQDFNDAVMLVDVTPFSAIQTSGIVTRDPVDPATTHTASIKPVDDPQAQDSDSDGVTDPFDAFPNDPTQAFVSSFPAVGDYGTLVFEDLWPKLGDYDFNDAVFDYNIKQITNASNQLVEIQAEYVVNALGGGFHSGFGFSTQLTPNQVASVSYTWEKDGVVQVGAPPIHYTTDRLANGLEANQSKAVVIMFDDGYDLLTPSLTSRPYYANVVPSEPQHTAGRVTVSLKLTQPVSASAIGTAPFNPFLIANGLYWGRALEIHLPGMAPTDKVDPNLFMTEHDTSNSAAGRYYLDSNDRPWAMNLPTKFTYLNEVLDQPGGSVSLGLDLRDAYLQFNGWVSSSGVSSKDWFRDMPNYRDTSKLYPTP
jgi:LruC domain-containing protein